ncbi:MAG: zf-HC2 domain-containing protein [Clostridia bacterium]|nr:zf-HC2 domain-containing protein [Clostridia bacterium]
MKTECSVVRDLLPLYFEQMVNPETAEYVKEHLSQCDACRKEYENLTSGDGISVPQTAEKDKEDPKRFRSIMLRLRRQFDSLAYSLIIFFIFLGFGWTGGENLMYNSLIMPLVGIFGYYVFRWRAIYKVPILLLIIDSFVFLFRLIDLDLYSVFIWTGIYSIFVLVGIAIAFLLHYAFRKESIR